MQDETNTEATATTASNNIQPAKHTYIEVGNDLLSKPSALVDTLLVKSLPATLIFCNSPSEADMVEVMLKKKGIGSSKLIGNIPYQRVAQEIQRVQNKEISALVITDVAAREMEVSNFEMVVNYGIPEDPEIYLHRITGYENAPILKEVLSLVSPLDFGNFHYLRKVAALNFDKVELPPAAEIGKAQAHSLIKKASTGEHLTDETVQGLLSTIMEHEDRDKIVAMLLFNTIKLLPKLQDDGAQRADNRGNYRQERQDRGGRNDRGDRGDRWNNNRGDRNGGRNEYRSNDGDDSGYSDRRSRNDRYDSGPIQRDARLYIGQGIKHGVSEDVLTDLVKSAGYDTDASAVVKRVTLRDFYTFVDVAEEGADEFITKMEAVNGPSGSALTVKKATFINCARNDKAEDSSEGQNDDQGSDGAEEAYAGDEA